MDKKEQEIIEQKPEEMAQVTGGTFFPNTYFKSEYEDAGIEVVGHLIDKDEFWWNGSNIGLDNADAVVVYKMKNGREPDSVEEALRFQKRLHADRTRN